MPARVAYDNLRAVVVRILVGGARTLTPRFSALASHYLVEACFCRPGEGHDKGGVESRGKAVRQQALVPIPSGPTLAGINAGLLAQMDARPHDDLHAVHWLSGALVQFDMKICGEVVDHDVAAVDRLQHQDLFLDRLSCPVRCRPKHREAS